MSDPDRNAVIWYADDGYDPDKSGLNGRRVAGASFLNGFFRHAEVDAFTSLTQGDKGKAAFAARLTETGRALPHRGLYVHAPQKMAPLGTLYYPSPNFAEQCWLRQRFGMNAWSVCGITHTTATRAVMQGLHDLRTSPQAEWDAIICTSSTVQAATSRNMDLADAHLRDRFGTLPPRPQMPVIPLGIDCDAFAPDQAAAVALRTRMEWGPDDIVVTTLSRLLPYGKFDPGPLFLALQAAQDQLGPSLRLHFVACGIYGDKHSESAFTSCARAFMPDVSYTHLDGADPMARKEALSGADIFTFPIDNIQETFGLAPIEAMAAGLPVVTSDWDGMRDTITPEVGIRVPTLAASAAHTRPEAWRYHCGRQTYAQYTSNVSAMTALDIPALTSALVNLARNPDLRRRMGQAGQNRARTLYDWAAIIPQMQDLWGELAAIRKRSGTAKADSSTPLPVAPSPMSIFASYPTQQLKFKTGRFHSADSTQNVAGIFKARRFNKLGQVFEGEDRIALIHAALSKSGTGGATTNDLVQITGLHPMAIERACLFLIKYGLARHQLEG